ncbi:DUF305 domain-containing protein [Campylobacter sp. Cr9]|uniref:CopM family metallochaperone n=1 Tax=unclassified Campylobacter TaxID=2593542 RepID=UPI001EFC2326|nr:DUF305 domain-containing protein [Campylobacter sp. RM5004]MBZ7984933.1 DUF305 domain-containing protein [Campylobacter sp. Cr9]ULO02197.1 DUF305 domain-containing protein [Campylobacter sp. RM5004]
MRLLFLAAFALSLSVNAKTLNDSDFKAMQNELNESMAKMHGKMNAGLVEKDPDLSFVVGMLPHHEGAVDMAKIVLKYGEDESIKKLAEDIIKAQEAEIKFMQEYLDKKGYKYPEHSNHNHH